MAVIRGGWSGNGAAPGKVPDATTLEEITTAYCVDIARLRGVVSTLVLALEDSLSTPPDADDALQRWLWGDKECATGVAGKLTQLLARLTPLERGLHPDVPNAEVEDGLTADELAMLQRYISREASPTLSNPLAED